MGTHIMFSTEEIYCVTYKVYRNQENSFTTKTSRFDTWFHDENLRFDTWFHDESLRFDTWFHDESLDLICGFMMKA